MNGQNPRISVVIPAFNEELFLGSCLKSLAQQNFAHAFEVIVVDNNSTDKTAEIAKKFGVRVVSESKRGVCAARQAGTVAAKGQIIVSTDADTVFAADWLSKIYAAFDSLEVVAVSGSFMFVDAPFWGRLFAKILFGLVHKIYNRTGLVKYFPASNSAFRKSVWEGYNVNLTQGGDELYLLGQFKPKGKIKYISGNDVFTSSRRLHKGLVYNLFVTGLLYYAFDYYFGRKTGKSVLGSYAAVRNTERPHLARRIASSAAAVGVMFTAYSFTTHHALASKIARKTGMKFDTMEDRANLRFRHTEKE